MLWRRAACAPLSTTAAAQGEYTTITVDTPSKGVARVALNRPDKSNAMNRAFWAELPACFDALARDPSCRAIVLVGNGKNFTAGLDISDHMDLLTPQPGSDPSRRAFEVRRLLTSYQDTFTSLERVRGRVEAAAQRLGCVAARVPLTHRRAVHAQCIKPIIAAVHGACIGGGVDMVCAADVRFCSADAFFCIKVRRTPRLCYACTAPQ